MSIWPTLGNSACAISAQHRETISNQSSASSLQYSVVSCQFSSLSAFPPLLLTLDDELPLRRDHVARDRDELERLHRLSAREDEDVADRSRVPGLGLTHRHVLLLPHSVFLAALDTNPSQPDGHRVTRDVIRARRIERDRVPCEQLPLERDQLAGRTVLADEPREHSLEARGVRLDRALDGGCDARRPGDGCGRGRGWLPFAGAEDECERDESDAACMRRHGRSP